MNLKHIISIGCIANVAEWYDFSIYVFMAGTMGQLFFDGNSSQVALLKALFLFTASYLIRPIGSFVWGYLGDCYGRKVVLRGSLMLMAVPAVLIGLLPVGNDVNMFSVIFIIIFRLIQGFAAGGELPMTACYVYEVSPPDKRNFFCSFVATSSMTGMLLGSAVASMTYHFFSLEEIMSYAWRIPFLFSFIVLIVVLYIRKNFEETEDFRVLSEDVNRNFSLKNWFQEQHIKDLKPLFTVMALYTFVQSAYYLLFVWLPQYLNVFLVVDKNTSFVTNTVGMISLVFFTFIFSYFTNKRYKLMVLISIISMACLCLPMFLLLQTKNFELILLSNIIFALLMSFIEAVMVNILAGTFQASNRCSGASISFVLPTAIFGGGIPTLCSYLIYTTGNNLIPAFVLLLICLLILPVVLKTDLIKNS
jgi:MFS transporter, MHS family, proline/betaine transporter